MERIDVEEVAYPEGGYDAWLTVLGAWCAMSSSMGLLNTIAVLQAWLGQNDLAGLPESTIGWIFSSYGFFLYFCGAQVGPIFDSHDIRFLVIPGTLGITLSLVFFSLSTEFYQFLLSFGVLGGCSASLLFTPAVAAIGHWFSARRALATGVACTAGGVGGVVFPLIILYSAPSIGFPWAIRIVALICGLLGIVACLTLRKRLPPNVKGGAAIDLGALVTDRNYAAVTLAVLLIEFAVFIPYSYISSYAISLGINRPAAYRLNALLNAGAIPGRALPGYIADRAGTFNTMCVTALTCTVFIFGLWYTADGSETRITAFAVLFGFWSGAAIALTPVCIGQVCDVQDYGKRNGTTFFVASFGVLTGIPIAGAILGHDNWSALVVFGGGAYGVALLAFVLARGMAGGWNLASKF